MSIDHLSEIPVSDYSKVEPIVQDELHRYRHTEKDDGDSDGDDVVGFYDGTVQIVMGLVE